MFGFLTRKSASRPQSRKAASYSDDATEVGSILDKEASETTSEKPLDDDGNLPQGSDFDIKVGNLVISSKQFHPDFLTFGDCVVACNPSQANDSSPVTYFRVHERPMMAAL